MTFTAQQRYHTGALPDPGRRWPGTPDILWNIAVRALLRTPRRDGGGTRTTHKSVLKDSLADASREIEPTPRRTNEAAHDASTAITAHERIAHERHI
jgi:hypothetical protein